MTALQTAYDTLVLEGRLHPDPAQAEAVALLSRLTEELKSNGRGWFGKKAPPKGVYLWGGVGRGKSMLMDLFFEHAEIDEKRRIHFHDFMQETHDFIADWRKLDASGRRRSSYHVRGAGDDPIQPAAKRIADEVELLCFDEFQVTDIADAMLLGRLYEQIRDRGIVLVATSNRHPDDLYKDGINRQLFVPFINLLKASNDVFQLKAERDYRLERLEAAPVYYTPLGDDATEQMQAAWERLSGVSQGQPSQLSVKGRKVPISQQAGGCMRADFDDLCNRPLGAADYLAIARQFHTVFIDNVPKLGPQNRNEAKRFVTLVDALYEARTKVLLSAAAEPNELYVMGDGAFEFERTASRLYEMRSHDYLAAERAVVETSDD